MVQIDVCLLNVGRQYALGVAKANNSPFATEMIITGKKKFE